MDLRTRTVRVSERCAQTAAAAAVAASSSPDEGLERSALRVDAQRHALPLLVLRDEPMDQLCGGDRITDQRRSHDGRLVTGAATFALPHRQQAVLVAVAEGPLRHRLKVAGVDPAAGDGVAALTHAGVVAQTTFVQVRVGQRVAARDPLGLDGKTGRQHAAPVSPAMRPSKATHRIKDQHAAEQVHRLVRGAVRQHVEHRQRGLKNRPIVIQLVTPAVNTAQKPTHLDFKWFKSAKINTENSKFLIFSSNNSL